MVDVVEYPTVYIQSSPTSYDKTT